MSDVLDKALAAVRTAANRTMADTAIEAKRLVVERTPLGKTGRARAGWKFDKDPASVDFFAGESVTLYTDAPHAKKLEWGASTQAPKGMLNTTLGEVPAILADFAQKAGNGG